MQVRSQQKIAGALAALAFVLAAASPSVSADSSGGGHGVSLNPTGLPPAGPPVYDPPGPPVGPDGPPRFRDGADLLQSLWPIPDKGIGSLIPDVPYLNHVYGATDFRPCERRDADGYLYQAC